MDQRKGLIRYYRKQVFYRFVWDLMQTNRSFQALFRIVEREKAHFVQSFCQSKDQGKSLLSIVLKAHNIPALFGFAFSLLGDILGRMPRAKRSRRQAVTNSES